MSVWAQLSREEIRAWSQRLSRHVQREPAPYDREGRHTPYREHGKPTQTTLTEKQERARRATEAQRVGRRVQRRSRKRRGRK